MGELDSLACKTLAIYFFIQYHELISLRKSILLNLIMRPIVGLLRNSLGWRFDMKERRVVVHREFDFGIMHGREV